MLLVFGFREEAEMYLLIEKSDGDWQAWEKSAGELMSLLYGSCAGVRSVAIDPLPSVLSDEVAELVGLDRERFVNRLVRGGA